MNCTRRLQYQLPFLHTRPNPRFKWLFFVLCMKIWRNIGFCISTKIETANSALYSANSALYCYAWYFKSGQCYRWRLFNLGRKEYIWSGMISLFQNLKHLLHLFWNLSVNSEEVKCIIVNIQKNMVNGKLQVSQKKESTRYVCVCTCLPSVYA